jgi:hypothetical protein
LSVLKVPLLLSRRPLLLSLLFVVLAGAVDGTGKSLVDEASVVLGCTADAPGWAALTVVVGLAVARVARVACGVCE